MKTKRPTAAQLDVLRKMRDGWEFYGGPEIIHDRYYIHGRHFWQKIRVANTTARCVIGSGTVEVERRDGARNYYRLTDAGLAALSGDKPNA
jgi:hypothetical protein